MQINIKGNTLFACFGLSPNSTFKVRVILFEVLNAFCYWLYALALWLWLWHWLLCIFLSKGPHQPCARCSSKQKHYIPFKFHFNFRVKKKLIYKFQCIVITLQFFHTQNPYAFRGAVYMLCVGRQCPRWKCCRSNVDRCVCSTVQSQYFRLGICWHI